jgi:hypothetical protein
VHEGIITPVPSGLNINDLEGNAEKLGVNVGKMLAVKSIDNIAIVITRKSNSMYIYRFDLDETTNLVTKEIKELWHGKIWNSGEDSR